MGVSSTQMAHYQTPKLVPSKTASAGLKALAFLLVAVVLHALFLIHIPVRNLDNGAEQEGVGGITVGIKRLTLPPAPAPAASPAPAPEVKPPKPKPKPRPKPEPKTVNKKLAPKPKPKPEPVKQVTPAPTPASADTSPSPAATVSDQVTKSQSSKQAQSGSAAPVAGGGNPKVRIKYIRKLAAWLERHKRYPNVARRRNQEGTVLLNFTVNQSGELQRYNLVKQSEYELLNEAVEKMINKATPMPKVPKELMSGRDEISFTVPVSFKMGRR